MVSNVLFGIILASVGSVSAATGLIIQKVTHNEDLEKEEEEKTHMMCRWKWWVGLGLLTIIPAVLEGWSLMLAPLSIIAPLSGTTVVLNTILAIWCLKEKTNWCETAALGLIVGGIALTSLFGSREQRDYTTDDLLELYQAWGMYVYYGCFVMWVLGSAYVAMNVKTPSGLNAFAYAIAGVLGGGQNVFLKCFTELLKTSIDGNNQFDKFVMYPIMLAVGILAIGQMLWLNWGMTQHDAVAYIPMYQATLAVYGSISGGIYFQEFAQMDGLKASMYGLGLVIVCGGLMTMGQGEHSAKKKGGVGDGEAPCEFHLKELELDAQLAHDQDGVPAAVADAMLQMAELARDHEARVAGLQVEHEGKVAELQTEHEGKVAELQAQLSSVVIFCRILP